MPVNFSYSETTVTDAPKYIRTPTPLSLPSNFGEFEVAKKFVTRTTQMKWCESVTNDLERGWQGIICGDIEYCRLMALYIGHQYSQKPTQTQWLRINGTRYVHRTNAALGLIIVDSLLQFNGQFDPVRWGNVFDVCSEYRGKSSVLVIVPGLAPEEATTMSHLRPDYMWYLRTKQRKEA